MNYTVIIDQNSVKFRLLITTKQPGIYTLCILRESFLDVVLNILFHILITPQGSNRGVETTFKVEGPGN